MHRQTFRPRRRNLAPLPRVRRRVAVERDVRDVRRRGGVGELAQGGVGHERDAAVDASAGRVAATRDGRSTSRVHARRRRRKEKGENISDDVRGVPVRAGERGGGGDDSERRTRRRGDGDEDDGGVATIESVRQGAGDVR